MPQGDQRREPPQDVERRSGVRDRRRRDRRVDWVALGDYPVPELRKGAVTALLLGAILILFTYMVHEVVVGAIAGLVLGIYMLPFQLWLEDRLGSESVTAILGISLVTIPLVAILVYSWAEISDAAEYLNQNREEVVAQLNAALHRLPFTEDIEFQDELSRGVAAAATMTTDIVDDLQEVVDILVISIAVFLFTVFYILTDHERISAYLRRRIHGRYRELAGGVVENIRAVVYGSLYATFLTQLVKSGIILLLNLIFDVPLALVLAIASFFIGFFPVVGSWSVYLPTAVYLMVFRENYLGGFAMAAIGFFLNTLFISMYLRPKIAAERSHVLNFYWMFIALVTGVYTFGIIGIVIGPVLIAVLKAILETLVQEDEPVAPSPEAEILPEGST